MLKPSSEPHPVSYTDRSGRLIPHVQSINYQTSIFTVSLTTTVGPSRIRVEQTMSLDISDDHLDHQTVRDLWKHHKRTIHFLVPLGKPSVW